MPLIRAYCPWPSRIARIAASFANGMEYFNTFGMTAARVARAKPDEQSEFSTESEYSAPDNWGSVVAVPSANLASARASA